MNFNSVPISEEDLFANLSKNDKRKNEKMVEIALIIKREREKRGMTQTEFANFLRVKQAQISKWESGDCNFTVSTLSLICDKLGLNLIIDISNSL